MKFRKKLSVFFSLMFACALVSCRAEFTGDMESFAYEVNLEIKKSPERASELIETSLKKFFVGEIEITGNDSRYDNVLRSLSLPYGTKIKSINYDGEMEFRYGEVPVNPMHVEQGCWSTVYKSWTGAREEILFEIESNGKTFYRVLVKSEGVAHIPSRRGFYFCYPKYYTYTYSAENETKDVDVLILNVFYYISGVPNGKFLSYGKWIYGAFEYIFGESYYSAKLKSLR